MMNNDIMVALYFYGAIIYIILIQWPIKKPRIGVAAFVVLDARMRNLGR